MNEKPESHPIDELEEKAPIPPVLKENSDQAFFIRFGIVVVLLHAVVGFFALAAWAVGETKVDGEMHHEMVDVRTRPMGEVFMSIEAAQANVPTDNAAPPSTAISGQQAVDQFCTACHGNGLLGAPRSGDVAAWKQREQAAGGIDGLLASAIHGKGQMPPRGGNPALTDEQVKATVDWMLANLK